MGRQQKSIRVLLCNSQKLLREGLKALFENADPIEIVGEAANAKAAIDRVQHLRPDVVLIDVELPGLTCFDTMVRILAIDPNIRIVILTLNEEDHAQVSRCLEAGAAAQIGRKALPAQLHAAIVAAAGRRSPSQATTSQSHSLAVARRG